MTPRTLGPFSGLDSVGYAIVPEVLPAATRARLHRAFDTAEIQGGGTEHVRIDDRTPHAEDWRALAVHPLVGAAADRVLARPYAVRDAHGRNPLRGYGLQGLHSDWMTRSPGDPYYVVTLLWMLDDFTVENGATRVVPGSHVWTRPLPKALAQPLAHHPEEMVVTGAAGSVLVFNGHLLHSGRRNEDGASRRTVQMVLQVLT